ncbi:MAG: hypothetical protein QM705_00215 [Ancrocorticia sp.]
MDDEHINLPLPGGPFSLLRVLVDYDGPQLFSVQSARTGTIFLANAVESDDERTLYLFSQVSPHLYENVVSGRALLRAAFTPPMAGRDTMALLAYSGGWILEQSPLNIDPIEEWLPHEDAVIRLHVDTLAAYEPSLLKQWADEQSREFVAIELEDSRTLRSEMPLIDLAAMLKQFQELTQASAQACIRGSNLASGFKLKTSDIKESVELSYAYSMAASFVAVVARSDGADTFLPKHPGLLQQSLARIHELLALVNRTPDDAIETLKAAPSVLRSGFKSFIDQVSLGEGDVRVDSVAPGQEVFSSEISKASSREFKRLLEAVPPREVEPSPFLAKLIGFNTRTGRFELEALAEIPEVPDVARISGTLHSEEKKKLLEELPKMTVGEDTRYWATVSVAYDLFGSSKDAPHFTLVWLELDEGQGEV